MSLDVRDVQSILQSKDHNSKLQIKGITRRHNSALLWNLNHIWLVYLQLQALLYSIDVNLNMSHVSITPVVLETHDQGVRLQATQTDSLKVVEQRTGHKIKG